MRLIREFSRLPGIGEKTAERLAMHVLGMPEATARGLSESILGLKEKIRLCDKCFGLSDAPLCRICADPGRDHTLVCVVEQPAEMVAVEKAGAFPGVYHILQGVLSPMDGVGPDDIRIQELLSRIDADAVAEVVLAVGTHTEGEATAAYLQEVLAGRSLKVSRIATGVPVGGDLKYVDQVTLKRALEYRQSL
jgi:recombination protein RecR